MERKALRLLFTVRANLGWNVNILLVFLFPLFLALGPVAASAVAAIHEVEQARERFSAGQIAIRVARQIAGQIAIPSLLNGRAKSCRRMTPVRHAAEIGSSAQECEAAQNAISSDGPETKAGTTGMPGVTAVSAGETLERRNEALIKTNGG